MRMSDGMFQNNQKSSFHLFFSFLFFLFFFHFVPHFHIPHILFPHKTFYISLMMSILMIIEVVMLMMIAVEGDDTQALRDTVSSLCSLNTVGQFASCCVSYDNGAFITLDDTPARSCFITRLTSTTGSILVEVFVICFIFVLFLL